MEDTNDTKVQDEEDNILGKCEKITVIIKILLSIIALLIGVILIIISVGDSNCSNSTHQLNTYYISSYNSMYYMFAGTNRKPSETKALIAQVTHHNMNQEEIDNYGKIILYYYGLEASEDINSEYDNISANIIKNTCRYDIEIVSLYEDYGSISRIRIVEKDPTSSYSRTIPKVNYDDKLFNTTSSNEKTRKLEINNIFYFILGLFVSILFAYYILSNFILLFAKEYSKENALLELIFMVTSSVPIIIILFIESISELLINNGHIGISCIYLALGIVSILVLVEFVKTYKDYVKTINFKEHSKRLIGLAFFVIIVYLLYGFFALGNEF